MLDNPVHQTAREGTHEENPMKQTANSTPTNAAEPTAAKAAEEDPTMPKPTNSKQKSATKALAPTKATQGATKAPRAKKTAADKADLRTLALRVTETEFNLVHRAAGPRQRAPAERARRAVDQVASDAVAAEPDQRRQQRHPEQGHHLLVGERNVGAGHGDHRGDGRGHDVAHRAHDHDPHPGRDHEGDRPPADRGGEPEG